MKLFNIDVRSGGSYKKYIIEAQDYSTSGDLIRFWSTEGQLVAVFSAQTLMAIQVRYQ